MDIKELMTAKEICQMFGCSESSLKSNFARTAASIKKKYNVSIVRSTTDGKNRFYQIFEDNRALTIYNEKINNIYITIESLSFQAFEFLVFLAVAASQNGVFRGKREDLLKYLGVSSTKKYIEMLNDVLKSLVKKDYIAFHQDQDFIIIYLKASLQKEHSISINMMRQCQKIANQNHKNFSKIPQLIQVWEAIRICEENQPFTYADLAKMTGLSYRQIRDVKRLLEQNDAFISNRAGSYFNCLGINVQLNGFFN